MKDAKPNLLGGHHQQGAHRQRQAANRVNPPRFQLLRENRQVIPAMNIKVAATKVRAKLVTPSET